MVCYRLRFRAYQSHRCFLQSSVHVVGYRVVGLKFYHLISLSYKGVLLLFVLGGLVAMGLRHECIVFFSAQGVWNDSHF